MITAELDTSTIEIANSIDNVALDSTNIIAGYDNSYNIDTEDLSDLDITVSKKEYTIIGDGIFIPSMYEDAPPWLKELIDTTINVAVINRDQSLIDRMNAILTAMDYVPKNRYTEQINQIVSEDGIINSRIATLNSNLTDAISSTNATVAEINLTYASKDEAAAIASNVITASLSGSGEIGSALIQLQEAYANLESTTAQSISMLESVMEGEINGNAIAMETIRTYVGIDEAGASTNTGLSAYLEASDGTIGGADSKVANDMRVTAQGVESKWEYNSLLKIGGYTYNSGFGIATSLTPNSGLSAGASEFWIKADKFKLMSANGTKKSSYSPFTVDANTGSIKFNGVVEFSNLTNVPQLGSTPQEVVNAVNSGQTTTINGGKITTGSITANQIQTGSITADRINSYYLTATNASIANGMITNAMIGTASITTLKIENEAVIVPRSASGGYSCVIYYSTAISHAVTILGEWVQGAGRDGVRTNISINGNTVRSEIPTENTLCTMFHNDFFHAGTVYTIVLHTDREIGHMSCRLLLLGTKR